MKHLFAAAVLFCATAAFAEIKVDTIEYKSGDVVCEGFLAYDPAAAGPRPGVVIVHDWMGPSDYMKNRAEELAKLGYTAFAVDIYGKDLRPKDAKEAGAAASKFKSDRKLLRALEEIGALRMSSLVLVKRGEKVPEKDRRADNPLLVSVRSADEVEFHHPPLGRPQPVLGLEEGDGALQQHGLDRAVGVAQHKRGDGDVGPGPAIDLLGLVDGLGELRALDDLRQTIAQLDDYQQNGAPWSYRWGLYQGNKLDAEARKVYFNRFRPMLLA